MAELTVDLSERDVRRIAVAVAECLDQRQEPEPGWLRPDDAARYLGVTRRRIYDLRSARVLEPDGFDGRTPLYTRLGLDAYARSTRNGSGSGSV